MHYELTAGYEVEDIGLSDYFRVAHRQLALHNEAVTTSTDDELSMLRALGVEVIRPRRDVVN